MSHTSDRNAPVDLKQARLIAEHVRRIDHWQQADDAFSVLQRRLGGTLELDAMMNIFSEELSRVVPFASLSYDCTRNEDIFEYRTGKGGSHHCSYNLTLNGMAMGTLRLNRRRRFEEDELKVLEQMVALLMQPMRNGWRFREAISASLTDSMTGLGNNRSLQQTLQKEIDLASRHQTPLTVILCDLDHFKAINDTYGHVFGDEVLARVGELLPEYVRGSDQCFRYGGEEFAVVLPHTDAKAARRVAERIREAIRGTRLMSDGKAVSITTSLGIASLQLGDSPGDLIRAADMALYEAKRGGRNKAVNLRQSA
ncbi:MAG: GGDEF domain-containing protein [Oleiphilaceae bacterium]|nr:GGDEF domain-containing protein [Oleiphilaceae bacterium]